MKNEMEILKMDERQRLCWLLANRLTLIVVGLCWLGLTLYKLLHGEIPYFLMIMLPIFAIVRASAYFIYKSRSSKSRLTES